MMAPLFTSSAATAVETHDQADNPGLGRIRTVSRLLDGAFRIPGTNVRFGIDPILGILPVAGDAVSSLLTLYIIFESYRADAPPNVLAKMVILAAVDFVVGSIPVIGPVFDAFWKNNAWSVGMLESHLQQGA